jgi:DNA topoisomerase-2
MDNEHDKLELFLTSIKPWYRHFTGLIEKISDSKFQTNGKYTHIRNTIKITELPIGVWSEKFEYELNEMANKKYIKYLNAHTTPLTVCFEFETTETFDIEIFKKKMYTFLNLDNIVVFDKFERIRRVTLKEVFDLWGEEKLKVIEDRKQFQLANIKKSLELTIYKIKFIDAVKNKMIILTDDEDIIVNKIKKIIPDINTDNINILLDLQIRTLTLQKLNKLKELEIKLKQEEIDLSKKTNRDIWKEDLENLKKILLTEKFTLPEDKEDATKIPKRRLILKK